MRGWPRRSWTDFEGLAADEPGDLDSIHRTRIIIHSNSLVRDFHKVLSSGSRNNGGKRGESPGPALWREATGSLRFGPALFLSPIPMAEDPRRGSFGEPGASIPQPPAPFGFGVDQSGQRFPGSGPTSRKSPEYGDFGMWMQAWDAVYSRRDGACSRASCLPGVSPVEIHRARPTGDGSRVRGGTGTPDFLIPAHKIRRPAGSSEGGRCRARLAAPETRLGANEAGFPWVRSGTSGPEGTVWPTVTARVLGRLKYV